MPTTLTPAVRRETLTIIPNQSVRDLDALPEGTLAQLIDGEIVMSPSPNVLHQHIVTELSFQLKRFVAERGLGVVLVAPIDVRFSESLTLQPDVVFVARERLGILGENRLEGAPDLVAEVLSPSTGYYDLTKKREIYERAGVQEYWIVDPERRTVEVLALEADGYRTAAHERSAGRVASVLFDGFAVELGALFDLRG